MYGATVDPAVVLIIVGSLMWFCCTISNFEAGIVALWNGMLFGVLYVQIGFEAEFEIWIFGCLDEYCIDAIALNAVDMDYW